MVDLLEDTNAARRRRKVIALTLLGLAVILLVVTILWWRSLPEEGEVIPRQPPRGQIVMTGAELMEAYQSDPALRDYSAEPIVVSAPLATTPNSGTTVLLRTADPLLSISADIVPTDAVRLAGAEPGEEITLSCTGIAPGIRAPILESCSLVVAP